MKDLSQASGLKVSLTDDNHLKLSEDLAGGDSSARKLFDLKDVLMDDVDLDGNRDLYHMYRDVHKFEDEGIIRSNGLRYDMTVILPGMIGEEYTKTLGHYHPDKEGQLVSYPEVYEVISGRAFYLLQRAKRTENDFNYGVIEEAYLVEVKAGEKAIMPPDFGHVTINIDNEPLVMSNWVCSGFQSDYSEIKKFQGVCYYLLKSGSGYQVVKNPKYSQVADIKTKTPKELEQFALRFSQPMYQLGIANISNLEYLVKPEDFKDQLIPDRVFK